MELQQIGTQWWWAAVVAVVQTVPQHVHGIDRARSAVVSNFSGAARPVPHP
jgi:hypothetical protein